MSLKEKLAEDLKSSMKNKDTVRKNTTVTRYTALTADNFLLTRLTLLLPQSTATIYLTMLNLFRLTRQKKKACLKS